MAETCQICFDQVDLTVVPANDGVSFINGQLCGTECLAKVCQPCLFAHLRATLDDCYPGILPRVRCPICLTRLNKTQWLKCVPQYITIGQEDAFVIDKYADFCRKACSFQAPCCHKVGYTHLPEYDASSDNAIDSANAPVYPEGTIKPEVLKFLELCREFCFHKTDGRTVIQLALDTFTGKANSSSSTVTTILNEVIEEALVRIMDDERRAALLLSYLYLRPAAITRCCKRQFCFNCKRNGHHETCDTEKIPEDDCVAQCRSCHVTIIKVEGCDSVTCVCGFTMSWGREIEIQRRSRRQLVAVDIFDRQLYETWDVWRRKLLTYGTQLAQEAREREKRAWLAKHARLLRKGFGNYLWRFRFQHFHERFQRELFWKVYSQKKSCDVRETAEEETGSFLAALLAIDVAA